MIRVILESPFAGNVEDNLTYARACVRDALLRGEAAIASHLIYPQEGILDDDKPEERKLGIEAGLVWGAVADYAVVYTDLGVSAGMQAAIDRHKVNGLMIKYRTLE